MNQLLQLINWVLFFCFINIGQVVGQENNLIKKTYYSSDLENEISIKNIKKVNFIELTSPKIGHKNGTYWFKVILKENNEGNIVFHFDEPSIKSITIYSSEKKISQKESVLGYSKINIQITNNNNLYYIKAIFKRQANFPLTVISVKNHQQKEKFTYLYSGLYYGLVIMVFLINLTFYVSLKDKVFIYYCYFLISTNIAFTSFDGILYLFFTPELIDIIIISSHFFVAFCGVIFAGYFLNLNTHFKRAHIVGRFFLIIPLVNYLLFFLLNDFIFAALGDLTGVLILTFYWILGIFTLKREKFALFFVIGYSIVLIAAMLYLIPLNFGLSHFTVSFNQLKYGALFEMIVLTYAITYRVKKVQEENEIIQLDLKNHINKVLELELKIESDKETNNLDFTFEEKINNIVKQHQLTDREADILVQIANGLKNQQIAEKLFISINTVKYHTRNLYEKLDVKKRTEITSKILFDK